MQFFQVFGATKTCPSHEIKSELHEAMKQQLLLYVAINYYYFFYLEKFKFTKTTMDALGISEITINSDSEDSDLARLLDLVSLG